MFDKPALLFCVAVITVGSSVLCIADDIRVLEAGLMKSQANLAGLRFEYKSSMVENDAPVIEAKNVYSVWGKSGELPKTFWKKWEVFSLPKNGTSELISFFAFDNSKTVLYESSRCRDYLKGINLGSEVSGGDGKEAESKEPGAGYIWPDRYDPHLNSNLFDQFLFTNLVGVWFLTDRLGLLTNELAKNWRIVGSEADRSEYSIEAIRNGTIFRSVVKSAPVWFVASAVITNADGSEILFKYEVEEFGELDGVYYPVRGNLRQVGAGLTPSVEYSFQVTHVDRLSEKQVEDWLPEFPPNTAVGNHIDQSGAFIPPAKEDVEERIRINHAPDRPGWHRISFILINFVIAGLVVSIHFWKKKRRSIE